MRVFVLMMCTNLLSPPSYCDIEFYQSYEALSIK